MYNHTGHRLRRNLLLLQARRIQKHSSQATETNNQKTQPDTKETTTKNRTKTTRPLHPQRKPDKRNKITLLQEPRKSLYMKLLYALTGISHAQRTRDRLRNNT